MQRAYRLHAATDLQRVRSSSPKLAHPFLMLQAVPNELQHPRVAIAVSRRIGEAVLRNRVRRRVREAVRLKLRDMPAGHDLLFIARAPSATSDWRSLQNAVDELLRRASLIVTGAGHKTSGIGAHKSS